MRASVKFLFDHDFAEGESPRQPAVPQADHEAALAAAAAEGYRKGLAAGKAEGAAETERKLSAALTKTATSLEGLARSLAEVERKLESDAAEVAVAVATRLASALIEREPLAEVAALAADCFRHVVSAPHVVVRISDVLYDEACARLTAIAERCGFAGRLIVLGEPEIAIGDCRIEWADGGMNRERGAVEQAIGEVVDRYLAARPAIAPAAEAGKVRR